jgi:hypothetical protein
MAIRFDGVKVLCDMCKGQTRAMADTSAALVDGQLRVLRPSGWSEEGDTLICPQCAEERALEKVDEAKVPDPANDPPVIAETRENRLKLMKEVVKADLEEREAEFPELREFVREIVMKDGDVPDFLGHIGDANVKTEVRVRGSYVEISFGAGFGPWLKGESGPGMSLTLKHEDLKLVDPPAFVDARIVEWVQNCLRTMTPDELSDEDEPVAQ